MKAYRVDHPQWLAVIPASVNRFMGGPNRTVVLDGGWNVVKPHPSPGAYQGIRLQPDPEIIATYDDEKTARAVCRDLNRAANQPLVASFTSRNPILDDMKWEK